MQQMMNFKIQEFDSYTATIDSGNLNDRREAWTLTPTVQTHFQLDRIIQAPIFFFFSIHEASV